MKLRLIALVISLAMGGGSTMLLQSEVGKKLMQALVKTGKSPYPDNQKKRRPVETAVSKRPTTPAATKTAAPVAQTGKQKHPKTDEELFAKYGGNFGYETGSKPTSSPSQTKKSPGPLGEGPKSPFDRKSAADGLLESVKNLAGLADKISPPIGAPANGGLPFGIEIPNSGANPADMKSLENILKGGSKPRP